MTGLSGPGLVAPHSTTGMYCELAGLSTPHAVWWKEGGESMAVQVRDNESLDSALRRFKRELHQHGVLEAARRKERYEKPSDRRRRMQAAAVRRARRAARRRGYS